MNACYSPPNLYMLVSDWCLVQNNLTYRFPYWQKHFVSQKLKKCFPVLMAYFCHNDITDFKIATMSLFGSNEMDVASSDLFVWKLLQNTWHCLFKGFKNLNELYLCCMFWYNCTFLSALCSKSLCATLSVSLFLEAKFLTLQWAHLLCL